MSAEINTLLKPMLVCPLCKAELAFSSRAISCTACGESFPQDSNEWVNLLPDDTLESDDNWQERQGQMEQWYEDLLDDRKWAEHCFAHDYEPFQPILSSVSGLVLDVGGGNGVVRDYLPDEVPYISLDPSLDWLADEWTSLSDEYPSLKSPPAFVRGVGEHLPFPEDTFDAVLAFWSLNHVSQPEEVFREVHRVLKPGGRFLAVLEDVEPRWKDLLKPPFRQLGWRPMVRLATSKLRCLLPNQQWPLQDDHMRIGETQLYKWSRNRFVVHQRDWVKNYLTYDLNKIDNA